LAARGRKKLPETRVKKGGREVRGGELGEKKGGSFP